MLFINNINHITSYSVLLQLERGGIKKSKHLWSGFFYHESSVLYPLEELLLIFLLQQSEVSVRVADVYGSGAAEVPRVDSAMTR